MSAITNSTFCNSLILALLPEDSEWLSQHCVEIDLPWRKQLEHPNTPITQVIFPERGIVSVVVATEPGIHVEGGIIGCEGMTALAVVLSTDRSPYSTYMQVAGRGQHASARTVRELMHRSEAARKVFLNFAQTFLLQVSETAATNARARLNVRLARWLLMADDRVGGGDIPLTHEFLAMMMGTRRAGVTVAMQGLASADLISTQRNKIIIRDRTKLEAIAGRYYGVSESEHRRMLPRSMLAPRSDTYAQRDSV